VTGLELDGQQVGALLSRVAHRLGGFVDDLAAAPALGTGPLPAGLDDPPPQTPRSADELLDLVMAAAAVGGNPAGPRFFGYIPGGGLVSSAVAETVARTVNRYTAIGDLAPGLVSIEESVLRWLAELFGLPAGTGGLTTTGGSQAMLSMLVAAREAHLGDDSTGARLYLSDQAHHCVRKAARIAGLPRDAVRPVATSDGRRLDPEALAAAVVEDRSGGRRPFLVVANAGTTNSGVVDPLGAVADVAAEHRLWTHVDACYGGFFQLTSRGRARLRGIERADSVSLDPHKSLFLPYGTGVLLVREPATLVAGHSDADPGDYLQDLRSGQLPDYASMGTELTREWRGLRLWLPLHLHGIDAFRAALDEKLDLAADAHDVLSRIAALEVPEQPELSTVVFRHRDGDDASQALLARIHESGRVWLSSTRLDGRLTLRLSILAFRTHREHVDEALELIAGAAGC